MNTKKIENPASVPIGWISSKAASDILSDKHGRKISDAYVRKLANWGKITTYAPDKRTKLYWQADVETCDIKLQGDGSVRRAVRGKKAAKDTTEHVIPRLSGRYVECYLCGDEVLATRAIETSDPITGKQVYLCEGPHEEEEEDE